MVNGAKGVWCEEMVVILVGNKCDLSESKEVQEDEAKGFAEAKGCVLWKPLL